jgi:hypothetical protein
VHTALEVSGLHHDAAQTRLGSPSRSNGENLPMDLRTGQAHRRSSDRKGMLAAILVYRGDRPVAEIVIAEIVQWPDWSMDRSRRLIFKEWTPSG